MENYWLRILLYLPESPLKGRKHPYFMILGVCSNILRVIFTIVAKSGN